MADLTFGSASPDETNIEGDDLLSILNREAQEAVRRIADQLDLPNKPRTGAEASSTYRLVCQAFEARRERAHFFDADLFSDPAWGILLAMFREHLAGRPIQLAAATKAADIPESTATRWLALLAKRGLVANPSPTHVELTPAAIEKLGAYVERLRTKSLMRVI